MNAPTKIALMALLALGAARSLDAQTFARTYGDDGQGPMSGYRSAVAEDGPIVSITFQQGSFGLLCTDAAGNPLWHRVYPNTWLTDIAYTDDGHFIACGGAGGKPFAMKVLASTGDVLWAKTFGLLSGVYRAIVAGPRGSITAVGEIQNNTIDIIFTTVSSSGRVQIQTKHGTAFEHDLCWDIDGMADGSFVLVSTTNFDGTGDRNVWIKHIAVTGVLLFAREIGTKGQDGFTAKPRVAVLNSGDVVVCAGRNETNSRTDDLWIVTLNDLFDVQSERTYNMILDRVVDVRATQDGGYAVLGQSLWTQDPLSDALLLKFDATGAEVFSKSYGGSGNDFPGGLAEAPNGDLVFCGTSDSFGTQDVWLLRVDAAGEASPCCTIQHAPTLESDVVSTPTSSTGSILDFPSVVERPVDVVPGDFIPEETAQCATNFGPWTDVGHGTPGQDGTPCLSGVGRLLGGTYANHILDGAAPLSSMVMVLGFTRWDLSLLGGTLVPTINLVSFGMTSVDGTASLPTVWPHGIPSGLTFFVQYLVEDDGGPRGYAFSNAIQAIIP